MSKQSLIEKYNEIVSNAFNEAKKNKKVVEVRQEPIKIPELSEKDLEKYNKLDIKYNSSLEGEEGEENIDDDFM